MSVPQDLVAIFHASFHTTQGHTIDWSLTANDDINLENVEFNVLPSGLHLVEQDVIYFTKDSQQGVCIFTKRRTAEEGFRGADLSSLGILVAKSPRAKPWHHVEALKDLVQTLSTNAGSSEDAWKPAREFFEARKDREPVDEPSHWQGWSYELDENARASPSTPTLHLPYLLRVLGPSCLTLYKYIMARRRILVYSHPPVEAACTLCHVAADMCYEEQILHASSSTDSRIRIQGRSKEPINVLGMVTLTDIDRLKRESKTGRGWIACTTDAILLERPEYYDLLIDLTTSSPETATRPSLYASKAAASPPSTSPPKFKKSTIRFSWSDVKLWEQLDRILQRDKRYRTNDGKSKIISAWTDVWTVYEDVCVICAGLWMNWRGNSLRGELGNDAGHVRSLGQGIEGRPLVSDVAMKRSSTMSYARSQAPNVEVDEEEEEDRTLLTTLALLQTFHAHSLFQLSTLQTFLRGQTGTVYLSAKDIAAFDLGPLSEMDAKYLEWLSEEYGGGAKLVVKRGWRDLFSAVFGYS